MVSQEIITSKNFVYYTSSDESASNPHGDRDDYIALAKVGEAKYLVLLSYYTTGRPGYMKIKDFWNDPIIAPEHYFIGEVNTEAELDKALVLTGFDSFSKIDFDDIWLYK